MAFEDGCLTFVIDVVSKIDPERSGGCIGKQFSILYWEYRFYVKEARHDAGTEALISKLLMECSDL
ncbi:MAG: hypothetical protein IKN93_03635 [Bacteroidales bacterium]|nr:hypothetical protein [Bacteroidales bacterium]